MKPDWILGKDNHYVKYHQFICTLHQKLRYILKDIQDDPPVSFVARTPPVGSSGSGSGSVKVSASSCIPKDCDNAPV